MFGIRHNDQRAHRRSALPSDIYRNAFYRMYLNTRTYSGMLADVVWAAKTSWNQSKNNKQNCNPYIPYKRKSPASNGHQYHILVRLACEWLIFERLQPSV